jgi:stage IV sporulation protein B
MRKSNIKEKTKMKKIFITAFIIILLILYIYVCSATFIPNEIVLMEGEKLNLKIARGISLTNSKALEDQVVLTASNINKEKVATSGNTKMDLNLFGAIKLKQININVIPKTKVVPLGTAIGMKLYTKGVLVVGMSQINTENNERTKPYENSGIEQGDMILSVNNKEVSSTNELIDEINESQGKTVKIKYERNNETWETSITPVKSSNEYKLGLWVRDVAAGVGTLTFYEPSSNTFMALGHGISDIDTEKLVEISTGELITANILSINKGEKGKPGEIRGTIQNGNEIGKIYKNTNFGVYGTVTNINHLETDLTNEIEVASRDEIQTGSATIICQLDNNKSKSYNIEIEKIYKNNNLDNKSMFIRITDKELLEKTGGIIQGMSGSPIIQNGKFIGAVTNVLVNDPTKGYGVFADIMIKELHSQQ